MEPHVTGPALVIMGMSLYYATQSSVVRRPGCTFSHVFFFFIWFSVCASAMSAAATSPNDTR